jgi:hypothetical protein
VPTFDCEAFEITGDANPMGPGDANPMGPPPPPPAPSPPAAPPPAVKLLVDAVKGRVEVPGVEAPLVNDPIKCLGEFDALTIGLLAGAKTAALGILGFFKLGYDIGKCEGKERAAVSEALTEAKAEQYCVADGGTPRRWVGDTLQCVYPEEQP